MTRQAKLTTPAFPATFACILEHEQTIMAKAKKINFEQSLEELEALVEQMEEGELSLEDSLKAFEQGIKLTRSCQQALKEAEQKVQLLLGDDEELIVKDFDTEELD
jgi:exodeoxyribonuclease VII small subunit